MSYQPTTLGMKSTVQIEQTQSITDLTVPDNFPLVLQESDKQSINTDIQNFNLENMKLIDIATICSEPEVALNKVLDQFLDLIDPKEEPKIYGLTKQLGIAMEKEKLDDLANKIINPEPGFFAKLKGKITGSDVVGQAWQQLRQLAGQKTTRICDLISNMETTLNQEMIRMRTEIDKQEKIKDQYSIFFDQFAFATVYLHGCLQKSKQQLAQLQATEPVGSTRLADLTDKVQALESRTLAVEGKLTKLPANQLVIRQLQNAGIGTIQETTTTATGRFADIKMTLLTLNGALMLQGVQNLANQGAELDKNLQSVQSKLMKQVVTTSANAPGKNRIAQAEQLKKAIQDVKEINQIVEDARSANKTAFNQASQIFKEARADMIPLGSVVRPLDKLAN